MPDNPSYHRTYDAETIRTLLDSAPLHPSGYAPIAAFKGPPVVLVYYHDPEMLTVERYDEDR